MPYLSIFSTLVTLAFTISVLSRYRRKGGLHLLFWGIGLIFYGLGTFAEAFMLFQFSELALKIWYLSGAMLTAAWLGQGTVNLLVRKRGIAATLNWVLVIVSILAFALIMTAPVTSAAAAYNTAAPASEQYKEILVRNGAVVLLTVLLNVYGTLTLVGGALYSAFLFWRKKVLINRLIGNILIAAGALLPAMAGTFVQAGLVDMLYASELLGVVLMYAGFLQATVPQTVKSTVTDPTPVA